MATANKNLSEYADGNLINISGKKFAIVVSEWNGEVTEALFGAAKGTLLREGATPGNIIRKNVPGDLPWLCNPGRNQAF